MCVDPTIIDKYYNSPEIEFLSPWSQHWRSEASFTRHSASVLELIGLLKTKLSGSSPKVLDVGCNGGTLTAHLATLSSSVVGVDCSAPLIRSATARFPGITFVQADARVMPFKKEEFDLVTCFSVIDYLDVWEDLLSSSVTVLKPGGLLGLQFVRTRPAAQEIMRSVCAVTAGRRRLRSEIRRLPNRLGRRPPLGTRWMTKDGRSVDEVLKKASQLSLTCVHAHLPKYLLFFEREFVSLIFQKNGARSVI